MRRNVVVGSVVLVCVVVGLCLLNRDKPQEPTVENDQPVVRENRERQEETQPTGPLSFWCGEIIVGEGPHRGTVELVAAPGKEAVTITADENGVCKLDSIEGMKPGEMYIKLRGLGKAPLMAHAVYKNGEEFQLHPLYQASRHVRDGKLTPLIAPHILSPAERKYRQRGQHIEGYVWSIQPYGEQVYGQARQSDMDVRLGEYDIELPPTITADFKPFEIDVSERYVDDEWMAKMAEGDKKQTHGDKNGLREYKTSVGTFKVVSCFGRQSINPDALTSGGMRNDMMQLPNGKWIAAWPGPFELQRTVELDGNVYLICDHYVLRYIGAGKLECVVSFERTGTKWSPSISTRHSDDENGFIAGRYYQVHKSSESDFGGLLEYLGGKWHFHPYVGDYRNWVEGANELDGKLVLTLMRWDESKPARQIEFNQGTKQFADL